MNAEETKQVVLAKVAQLDAALTDAARANGELLALGREAKATPATSGAFDLALCWEEFGDPESPQRGCKLASWRAAAQRNGWLGN